MLLSNYADCLMFIPFLVRQSSKRSCKRPVSLNTYWSFRSSALFLVVLLLRDSRHNYIQCLTFNFPYQLLLYEFNGCKQANTQYREWSDYYFDYSEYLRDLSLLREGQLPQEFSSKQVTNNLINSAVNRIVNQDLIG